MSKKCKNILIIIAWLGLIISCAKPNVLTELSSMSSDEAFFIDAQKEIDASRWDNGISIIQNKISGSYRSRRNVVNTLASAYAGKCGVNFLNLVNGLKGATGSASQIFPYFLSVFAGVTVTPTACESAITLLQGLGPFASRTADENLFLAILGVARIATNLSLELDSVDKNGIIDASSNICHEWSGANALYPWPNPSAQYTSYPPPAKPAHFLLDLEMKRIASGVGLIVENISVLGNIIGSSNSVVTAVNSVTATCATIGIACNVTDPAVIDNNMIYGFRGLLDSGNMGFGTCVPGSAVAGQICCPSLKNPPWP